jgi:hypothetical protein
MSVSGSFLCTDGWYSTVWTQLSTFNHLPTEGHLGHLHFGDIMKEVAMNIQVSMWAFRMDLCFLFSGEKKNILLFL